MFTLDSFVPDIVNMTRNDLKAVVRRLISDRVVVQIFRLEFEPDQGGLILKPFFIGNPKEGEDAARPIYMEANFQSIRAIQSFLDSTPRVSQDRILQDLELDLSRDKTPTVNELHNTLVDPLSIVHAGAFEINPPGELIQATLGEIRSELFRAGRLAEINDYGLMALRDGEIMERFEVAGEFLKNKVIARYKNKGNLKRELEQIGMEEATYQLDPLPPPRAYLCQARSGGKTRDFIRS